MNSPPAQTMNAEKLTGTTGSLPKLLEKEKHNPDHQRDLQAIREFIDEKTGFKYAYGSCNGNTLTLRAFAK